MLVDIAMSQVEKAAPNFADPAALNEIRNSFSCVIRGGSRDRAASLLMHHIGTTHPLTVICTILDVPGMPPPPDYNVQAVPGRRRPRIWSASEDVRLLAAVHRFGTGNWNHVAAFVGGGRLRSQCAQRWCRCLDPRISRRHWCEDEEAKLIALISQRGRAEWTGIAAEMGNRSDVQCRYHFLQMQRNGKVPKKTPATEQKRDVPSEQTLRIEEDAWLFDWS
jgi:hypothetical protein